MLELKFRDGSWKLPLHCHRQTRQTSACPVGLEVEPSGDAVNIKAFAGEVEVGDKLALHGFEIDFLQPYTTAGDELVLP